MRVVLAAAIRVRHRLRVWAERTARHRQRGNGPASAPEEAGATPPPRAAKPAGGRKSGDAAVLKENLTAETPAKPEAANASNPLDGYIAGKKPVETHRIRKVLGQKVAYGGELGVMTEGEFVERAVRDGKASLSASASLSKGGKPTVSFSLGGHAITKTAADYARAIGAKVDGNSIARADEYLSLHSAVKAREAHLRAKGLRGGEIESFSSDAAIEKLLASRRFANPFMLTPTDRALVKELNAVKEARIERGDWRPEGDATPVHQPKASHDTDATGGIPQSAAKVKPPAAEKPATPAPKAPKTTSVRRGERVLLKGTAEGQRVTFLKDNGDGTADVQVKMPGANRYMPEKVETRTVKVGDIGSSNIKDALSEEENAALRKGIEGQGRAPSVRMKDGAAERKAKAALDAIDFPSLSNRKCTL